LELATEHEAAVQASAMTKAPPSPGHVAEGVLAEAYPLSQLNEQLVAPTAAPPKGALHPVTACPVVSLGNVQAFAVQAPAMAKVPPSLGHVTDGVLAELCPSLQLSEQLETSTAVPPCGALHPVVTYPLVSLGRVHRGGDTCAPRSTTAKDPTAECPVT
jgi:hypothetical protein